MRNQMQLEGIPIFEKNYTDFSPAQKHRDTHAFPAQTSCEPTKKAGKRQLTGLWMLVAFFDHLYKKRRAM